MAHAYPVCHREERRDVAISFPRRRPLPRRDCRVSLAMTFPRKLGTREFLMDNNLQPAIGIGSRPVPSDGSRNRRFPFFRWSWIGSRCPGRPRRTGGPEAVVDVTVQRGENAEALSLSREGRTVATLAVSDQPLLVSVARPAAWIARLAKSVTEVESGRSCCRRRAWSATACRLPSRAQ